jgi:hypothetical protein
MPRKTIAATLGELELLLQSVTPETTAGDPQVANARAQLQEAVEKARQHMGERDFHTARKQEATARMQEKLEESCRIATFLRSTLRWSYRKTPASLAAFRVKPPSGRPRGRKSAKSAKDPAADPGGNPAPA